MASALTPFQLSHYASYIGLPAEYHPSCKPAPTLHLLNTLYIYHITTIPYENLVLHYSLAHVISLEPAHLATKLTQNGRGGYCHEGATLFNHVLRAYNFSAYIAGVRIRQREEGVPKGDFSGWTHAVNLVTFADGTKYLADVAFGGDGSRCPLPLTSPPTVIQNLATQELRVVHGTIPVPGSGVPPRMSAQKHWIYQYRNEATAVWNSFYAFPELEFYPPDLQVSTWYTGYNPLSFLTKMVVVVRFLGEEGEGGRKVVGKVTLANGTVKRLDVEMKKMKVVRTCISEEERVIALNEEFGITLTAEERIGIKGMKTEIIS